MNLKSFIIASIIIHVVGAIALYFYYNPIHLAPEPVEMLKEELAEEPVQKLQELRPQRKKKISKVQRKKITKPPTPTVDLESPGEEEPAPALQDALSLTEKPFPEVEKPFMEPKAPSLHPQLEEVNKKEPIQTAQSAPKNLENFEMIEEDTLKTVELPQPSIQTAQSAPKNLENFEMIEEDTLKTVELPQPPIQTTQSAPKNLENFEMIEEDTLKTVELPQPPIQTTQSAPKNLENFEMIEEDTLKTVELPQPPMKQTQPSQPSFESKDNSSSFKQSFQPFHSLKQKLGNPSLSYPDFARREGMQGTVSVVFFVTPQGLVDQIQLESSSGHSELDNFVIRTLAQYEFFPNQDTWVRYKIPFILKGVKVDRLRLRQNSPDTELSEQ